MELLDPRPVEQFHQSRHSMYGDISIPRDPSISLEGGTLRSYITTINNYIYICVLYTCLHGIAVASVVKLFHGQASAMECLGVTAVDGLCRLHVFGSNWIFVNDCLEEWNLNRCV